MLRSSCALALALLLACDPAVEPDPPRPAAVSVTPSAAELTALEATLRLAAAVRDQNGQPMPSAAVAWTSVRQSVATVDGAGVVTAVGNGTAAITATAGTVSASTTVMVAQVVASVVVTPEAATVVETDTLRLAAVAVDANGHEVGDVAIAWTSADTLVAVVDRLGLVTGVANGAVAVEGLHAASGMTGEAAIEVVAPVASAVAVTPDTVVFAALGDTMALSAEVFDQVGRVMQGAIVSWSSGDTAVAMVDSAGVVTAVAEGKTVTMADAGGESAATVVRVEQVAASAVVTPAADTVALGDTLRLSGEAFDGNGHRVAGARFVWQSSDSAVARVDESGLVTGTGEGSATVTALAGGAIATSAITVDNPDRAALVALAEWTGVQGWKRNDNWLTDAPLGTWYGVSERGGRVIGLDLQANALVGRLPPELGNLTALEELYLAANPPFPDGLGGPGARLESQGLSGALPETMTSLHRLRFLSVAAWPVTRLCAPDDPEFQRWLDGIEIVDYWSGQPDPTVPSCPPYSPVRTADLMQAVQTLGRTVPLVAGRGALIRVFLTQPWKGRTRVSGVRASFYEGGSLLYTRELGPWSPSPPPPGLRVPGFWPGKPLPSMIATTGLDAIATDWIPGDVVRPGLEMVVEVELDPPGSGTDGRIPAEGRIALDVRAVPTMELTIVPIFHLRSVGNPVSDSLNAAYIATVKDMAARAEHHEVLAYPRALLPTNDWSVTAHEPVWLSTSMHSDNLFNLLVALRAMEGGRGYWMGTGPGSALLSYGSIILSTLDGLAIAHELGHSMGLGHARCSSPANGIDPRAPPTIGVWGFDARLNAGRFVRPDTPALMSYCIARCFWESRDCPPKWISPYHFTRALHARSAAAALAPDTPTRTLLLWGGESESGGVHLDPAFVVDAVPVLPASAGGYTLTGRDAAGRELFSVAFAMPEVVDAGEDAGGFAYTLPVQPGWETLGSVTLTAPDGRTAVLDGSTDQPMTILRDARTGQVRAFLDGPSTVAQADGGGEDLAAKLRAVAITSRGIPDAIAWRR